MATAEHNTDLCRQTLPKNISILAKKSGNTTAHKLEGWVLCKPFIHSQKESKRIINKEGGKKGSRHP